MVVIAEFSEKAVNIQVVNFKIFTNWLLKFNFWAHVKIEIMKTGPLSGHSTASTKACDNTMEFLTRFGNGNLGSGASFGDSTWQA